MEQEPKLPRRKRNVKVRLLKVKVQPTEKSFSLRQLLIFALIFAAVGGYYIWHTYAAPSRDESGKVTISGVLEVNHFDDFNTDKKGKPDPNTEHWKSRTEYYLKTANGKKYRLNLTENDQKLKNGSKLKVSGTIGGSNSVFLDPSGEDLTVVSEPSSTAATGTSKVAVVMINFSDDTREPVSPAEAKKSVFTDPDSVNAYYQRSSYGKFKMGGNIDPEGDVFGWVTIGNKTACNAGNALRWSDEAGAILTGRGIDMSAYDYWIYTFPNQSCGWGGFTADTKSFNNGGLVSSAAHEFGHSLGLNHANGYECLDSYNFLTAISNNCKDWEYADHFDIMGWTNSYLLKANTLNAFHIEQLGWLPAANIQTVRSSGKYTLRAIETPSDSTQLIKIPHYVSHGNVINYIYLEYMRPKGSQDSPYPYGVVVHAAGPYNYNSMLLDNEPERTSFVRFTSTPLATGRTFTDGNYKIYITPISTDSSEAIVKIDIGRQTSTADNAACVEVNAPRGFSNNSGSYQNFPFNATIKMKNSGKTTWQTGDYQLRPMLSMSYLWGGLSQLTLSSNTAPGETATFSGSFTSPGYGPNFYSSGGQYGFNWRMYKNSTSEWFGQPCLKNIVIATDISTPTTPQNLRVTAKGTNSVSLSWDASTLPNNSLGYVFFYKILRITSKGTYLAGVAYNPATTFTDNGVSSKGTYNYVVVGVTLDFIESPPSTKATIKF